MYFYRYFESHGLEALVDDLASMDPLGLPPAEIVERILAFGNVPDIDRPSSKMWPTKGQVYEVSREEQDFLVAVSREAQDISVQEMRADAYDSDE